MTLLQILIEVHTLIGAGRQAIGRAEVWAENHVIVYDPATDRSYPVASVAHNGTHLVLVLGT